MHKKFIKNETSLNIKIINEEIDKIPKLNISYENKTGTSLIKFYLIFFIFIIIFYIILSRKKALILYLVVENTMQITLFH